MRRIKAQFYGYEIGTDTAVTMVSLSKLGCQVILEGAKGFLGGCQGIPGRVP